MFFEIEDFLMQTVTNSQMNFLMVTLGLLVVVRPGVFSEASAHQRIL